MEKLRFYISEYEDGNMELETRHIHYTFREDLNFDDFPPEELKEKMMTIRDRCRAENIEPYFQFV